jgi:hypothetical protein
LHVNDIAVGDERLRLGATRLTDSECRNQQIELANSAVRPEATSASAMPSHELVVRCILRRQDHVRTLWGRRRNIAVQIAPEWISDLEMARSVHPTVHNADYVYSTVGDAIVDDVAAHAVPAISLSNVVAGSTMFRIVGQQFECVRQLVGISMRLFNSPLLCCVHPNRFEILYRRGR